MDIEKLKVLAGVRSKKTQEEKRLEVAIAKIGEDAEAIRTLQRSRAWKVFDEFFQAKRDVLAMELKTCKKKDLDRLQIKAQLIDELYNFMNSKLLRDL